MSVDRPTNLPIPQTPALDAAALVAALRHAFDGGRTRPIEWRLRQLDGLGRLLAEREPEILSALAADLGKPSLEGFTTEVGILLKELAHTRRNLARWMRPEKSSVPLVLQPARAYVQREPLGVVLVIAPWNYPFQLAIAPLLAALAAGNCVLVKPSEVAPATSALLARRLPEYLDPDCVKVVEGGVKETTAILAERFDHILYTGNGTVGRIVMEAAARHLTPVTLELGGKSPVVVDRDADLAVTARRLAWGKWSNAGQTCIAPDYVLVHASIKDALVEKLRGVLREFYGADPKKSPDYGRIVNARHHRRLMALLPDSGRVVCGGDGDEAERYIAPTILDDVPEGAPIMQGEIFGPILPVLAVRDIDDAIAFINRRDKPLALYVFSQSAQTADHILARTSAGGVTVNHTMIHFAALDLPFGGVGPSGMGAYHGRYGFETFSHRKAVVRKPTALDPPILYPPYDETKKKWLRRLA